MRQHQYKRRKRETSKALQEDHSLPFQNQDSRLVKIAKQHQTHIQNENVTPQPEKKQTPTDAGLLWERNTRCTKLRVAVDVTYTFVILGKGNLSLDYSNERIVACGGTHTCRTRGRKLHQMKMAISTQVLERKGGMNGRGPKALLLKKLPQGGKKVASLGRKSPMKRN